MIDHRVGLLCLQIAAHVGLISMLFWSTWPYWLCTVLGYFVFSCVGTSIGYHRLFGHRSFDSPKWFENLCLHSGNLALVGSSISWVASHRAHHRFSDQDAQDTHSPHHHAWFKVIWLAMFQPVHVKYVKDLLRSKPHVLWHKWYIEIHICLWIVGLLLMPQITCALLIAPQALTWSMGATLNWVNHMWGYRAYDTSDHSKNNWFYGIFYWGEGWHNNHHANPKSYKIGQQWWEVDVGARIIDLVKTN